MIDAASTDLFGFTVLQATVMDEVTVIGYYFFVVLALQIIAYALTSPNDSDRLATSSLLMWLPVCPLIVMWALNELFLNFTLGSTQRLTEATSSGISFMRTYIALQVVGTVVESAPLLTKQMDQKAITEQLRVLGHHVLSSSAYFSGLVFHRCWPTAIVLGLTEVSTIFLNLLLFCKHEQYKDAVTAKAPWLLPASGVLLWLSFIFFRLLLIPTVVALFIYDSVQPESPQLTMFEYIYYPAVSLFVLGLSVVWFFKIHAGMMKQLKLLRGGVVDDKKKS